MGAGSAVLRPQSQTEKTCGPTALSFDKEKKGDTLQESDAPKKTDSLQEFCSTQDATLVGQKEAAVAAEGSMSEAPTPTHSAREQATAPENHTFKVSLAMTGALLTSVVFPIRPAPCVKNLKEELMRRSLLGSLVRGSEPLRDDHIFLDLRPGGETDVGLIKGNYIDVKEGGFYNGIYEQVTINEGRPAFKMVKPDNPRSGERWIYYSSGGRIVSGWKFNDRYVPGIGEWDMLAPDGPGTQESRRLKDDIPEGKFRLDNGGTKVKPHAPKVSKHIVERSEQQRERCRIQADNEEQENVDGTEAGGCFNGEAKILMADGSSKPAREVQVGDLLLSGSGGSSTRVEACIIEARSIQQLVKLDNLFITPHHPVVQNGRWTLPHAVPGASFVDADIELYNFITTNREPIHVEGFVATSIGTFCEDLHDQQNPEHSIWGTDVIVHIYQMHPMWPNIISTTKETCAAVAAAMEGGARGQVWCLTEALTAAKDRRDRAAETSMVCAS